MIIYITMFVTLNNKLPVIVLITNCYSWKINFVHVFDRNVHIGLVFEIVTYSSSYLSHKYTDGHQNSYAPTSSVRNRLQQECIPVGCVPPALGAVCIGGPYRGVCLPHGGLPCLETDKCLWKHNPRSLRSAGGKDLKSLEWHFQLPVLIKFVNIKSLPYIAFTVILVRVRFAEILQNCVVRQECARFANRWGVLENWVCRGHSK